MAGPNEINVGRINRLIQKAYGVKGRQYGSSVSTEVVLSHTLLCGVENRYLESWNRFANGGISAAVAAKNSVWRFRNPVGSNAIVVIEKLQLSSNPATQVQGFTGAASVDYGTVLAAAGILDFRSLQTATLVISSSGDATLSGGNLPLSSIFTYAPNQAPGDVILFEDQELTILPGRGMDFDATTVNQSLVMGVIWRERFLEEAERAF